MIISFGDRATEDLYHGRQTKRVRHFPADIRQPALRELDMLNAAHRLDDLAGLSGNRLESMRGDLKGYYSIRVNEQWRIIFRWVDGGAQAVCLTDYH